MQYADEVGLSNVLARMQHYQSSLGEYGKQWFAPSKLLLDLVEQNKSFSSLNK